MTFEQLLRTASESAKQHNKEPEAVRLLLMELSEMDPHQFFLNLKTSVSEDLQVRFHEALDAYLISHVPIQHLIGHAYFYGYRLLVDSNVLIPRPETEQLVEHVLYYYDRYFQSEQVRVLDLGTGSGCIAITLALEESNMDVTGSDISEDALMIARKNAEIHQAKVTWIQSDLFDSIEGRFDIIVSNPPYIPIDETIDEIVKKEPSVALYGGMQGTEFYQRILEDAHKYLNPRGLIAFEHGYQQKEALFEFIKTYLPNANVIQLKDLSGKDRMTFVGIGDVLSLEER